MNGLRNVAVLVGSLRRESYSRKLANALIELAPDHLTLEVVEIGGLEHYNQDFDDEHRVPESWLTFRDTVKQADAALFVTPEYNRSVPGVLKNAIDVGSRPYGQSVWQDKPAAVVSNSPGAVSGFGANHHLRQSLVFLNMPTLQQPEAYIGGVAAMFDTGGRLSNDGTREFCRKFMDAFAIWIDTTAPVQA